MAEALTTSSISLCNGCHNEPYDVTCTCGEKFSFKCIQEHATLIGLEFQCVEDKLKKKLQESTLVIKENDCNPSKTIIENWKTQRINDINEIANSALDIIQQREDVYSELMRLRTEFDNLNPKLDHIVHDDLTSILRLERLTIEKSDELTALPELLTDDISLDAHVQSRLKSNIIQEIQVPPEHEPILDTSHGNNDTTTLTTTELINTNPVINDEPQTDLSNDSTRTDAAAEHNANDSFDRGRTSTINCRNPIVIAVDNDNFVGTVCCHENQMLYIDYNETLSNSRLILIADIRQPETQQIISWDNPDEPIDNNDDSWIQDIAHSSKLGCYLLLNRSGLRILRDGTDTLEEFHRLAHRTMKRVTCDDNFIYLISGASASSPNGDEVLIINYDKEIKACKTLRDIIGHRRHTMFEIGSGEITDIAVSPNGRVVLAYRFKRIQQVGINIFNIENDGNQWSIIKPIVLNECWQDNLPFSPRVEWCEKLGLFIFIEYVTSHLIMIDENGRVRGECVLKDMVNERESPLNMSISSNSWFCVRFETSINVARIGADDDQ